MERQGIEFFLSKECREINYESTFIVLSAAVSCTGMNIFGLIGGFHLSHALQTEIKATCN